MCIIVSPGVDKQISTILGNEPFEIDGVESTFINWCGQLGIPVKSGGKFNHSRKYWLINLDVDFDINKLVTGEFPEGRMMERIYKLRERDPTVVKIAQANYKSKHGCFKCEVCNFNFEQHYGKLGEDFIESHHLIAVKDMPDDHVTLPEDIALLCSNCVTIWFTVIGLGYEENNYRIS